MGGGKTNEAIISLPPFIVVDVAGDEERGGDEGLNNRSYRNSKERELAFLLSDAFLSSSGAAAAGSPACFLTFYRGQVSAFEGEIRQRRLSARQRGVILREPIVHTSDSFQGSEAETVILSCVRSRDIGFLRDH